MFQESRPWRTPGYGAVVMPERQEVTKRLAAAGADELLRVIFELEQRARYVRASRSEALYAVIAARVESWARRVGSTDEVPGYSGNPAQDLRHLKAFVQRQLERVRDEHGMPASGAPTTQPTWMRASSNTPDERIAEAVTLYRSQIMESPDPRKVMVVYGRDSEATKAMFDFLRALDLKPQEWSTLVRYANNGAPYVGDVLSEGFSHAQAVVVLLTPDDEARLSEELRGEHEPDHERALMGQARPNVLFEAGMAFGTHPERTIVVELGALRPFSDIHGRHTIRLDGTVPPLREIARRLQAAGCVVDESGDDWLRTDRFPAPRHRGGSSTGDGAGRRELLTAAAGALTNALDAFERRKGATDENVTERGEAFDASVHDVALLANQVAIEFGQQHPAAQAYERALTWLRTLKAAVFDAQATMLPAGMGEDAAKATREAASEFIGAAQAS